MDARAQRVAKNETLFREVNERIKDVNVEFAADQPADFLCECGSKDCTEPVGLSLSEYEEVRRDPTHFFIVPGHELPNVERVLSQNARFAVVEKIARDAVEEAVEKDPRT
jgi:hypothetical protein